MSEARTWYLFVRGRQEGPMTREELAERLQDEERSADVLVLSSKPSADVRVPSYFDRAAREAAAAEPPEESPRRLEYTIHGDDLQFAEIWLDPGEGVVAEPGSMMYLDAGVRFAERPAEDPSEEGMPALAHFTNAAEGKRKAAFSAPHPGRILSVDLRECDGEFYCRRSSFLCADRQTKLAITLDKGVLLLRLGGEGSVFVHAFGAVLCKDLKAEETLRASADCILGFSKDVDCELVTMTDPAPAIYGGEDLFWADLTGPGRVWLQSLPFSRFAAKVNAAAPQPSADQES